MQRPEDAYYVELPEDGIDFDAYVAKLERAFIIKALYKTDCNKTKAAKLLGWSTATFHNRYRRAGVQILRKPCDKAHIFIQPR